MTDTPLIEIEGLRVIFHGDNGRTTHAVDRVDLSVANGATLGHRRRIRLRQERDVACDHGAVAETSAEISGSVRFDGIDLLTMSIPPVRDLRGDRLAMIFQEPMTSLNPSFTVGEQIIETLMRHRGA